MPPAKKSYKKRSAPKKNAPKKKTTTNVGEFASCSCVRTLALANSGQLYDYSSFQLSDFPRAVSVARAYQHFRITGIKVTWKPSYDTYSSATLQQKPNLYYMIDKSASIPTSITLEGLKQMGARPKAFDEKPITVTWKPSVLQDSQSLVGSVASSYKISPWLGTNSAPDSAVWNPSQIQHNGLKWWMDAPGTAQQLQMEVELQFQFKKPLVTLPASLTLAAPLVYAVIDASPDGIEGGNDGITIPLHA